MEDWAVRLRNRLGLGHLDPGPAGRPVEILVMRYPVAEAIAALDGQGHPTIPTVWDGDISNYFFPSLLPRSDATEAPLYSRTVNLTPAASENDYEMGCELLSPRLVYRPEYFYWAGIVAEPVTMPLARLSFALGPPLRGTRRLRRRTLRRRGWGMNALPVSPAIQRWQARFAAEPGRPSVTCWPAGFFLAPSRERASLRP